MTAPTTMANALLDAFPDEEILLANSLGTITRHCLVLRGADGRSHTILPVADVAHAQELRTTYPGLLVISSALALLAAAAQCSKDGHGAGIPLGILAVIFVVLYFNSRRASLLVRSQGDRYESVEGRPKEAAKLLAALREAQRRTEPLAA